MEKSGIKKTHILIAVYIFLIVIELFFYVPYHKIQIFITENNVPHTEIIGSGYATMEDIEYDKALTGTVSKSRTAGKRVDTLQLFINVSITTIVAVGLYFILQKSKRKIAEKNIPIPILDINGLAFATEEEVTKAQEEYARQMVEYIKGKEIL